MKNKISKLVFILILMATFYFLRTGFVEYNSKKTISACILAKKQTSQSFNLEEAKKFCKEEIGK